MKRSDGMLHDLMYYLKRHKRWWLTPMIIIFGFFALVFIVSQVAPIVSPFIYTVF